ncbi:hypothetical protein HRbin36_02488 [bacterium HR36]|nr:hypothetical protein HRbin36_02488 [bacterium HR36]
MLHETDQSHPPTSLAPLASQAVTPPACAHSELAIVAISSLGHALCHMGELAITGALVAIRHQFELDRRMVTALPYLGYVLLGLGAIPAGLAVDRWSADRVLRWYYFALAFAASMVALSTSTATLFLSLTLLGIVLSVYHPAGTALISVGMSRREWAMGINGVAGSIGVSLGPLLGGLWASCGYWQGAFWTLAGISLLGGLLMRQLATPNSATCIIPKTAPKPQSQVAIVSRTLPWLAISMLYICMTLGGLNYRTLVTALPVSLTGDSSQAAALAKGGFYSFAILLAGTIGQYTSGVLAQRFGSLRIYTLAITLMVPLAAMLAWQAFPAINIGLAGFLAITLFAQQPVENSLLAEGTAAQRRGLSYGAKFALTFGIGAVGAPLVGLVWHYTAEPRVAFWLFVLTGTIMLLALAAYRVLRSRIHLLTGEVLNPILSPQNPQGGP